MVTKRDQLRYVTANEIRSTGPRWNRWPADLPQVSFDELNDHAKETARDWYRGLIEPDEYSEYVLEDATRMGAILGINFNTRSTPLMNGKSRQDPNVYWDLGRDFGASVAGYYSYKKGSVKAIKAEAPQDKDLHSIAERLQLAQRRAFYKASAVLSHGRQSVNQRVEVEIDGPWIESVSEEITEALRDFAHWVACQLRTEYEYRQSDEAVDEDIRANGYEFTEDGKRA